MAPQRIQRQRRKGWRLPDGARIVDRTTRYGNPWHIVKWADGDYLVIREPTNHRRIWVGLEADAHWAGQLHQAHAYAVERYADDLGRGRLPFTTDDVINNLAGHDLACPCPATLRCHADVLLRVANREGTP